MSSIAFKRNVALTALAGVGALVAANTLAKPSRTQAIASGMRSQLDDMNAKAHPEEERSDRDASTSTSAEGVEQMKP